MLLKDALKAELPIISCTTTDPYNAKRVLKYLSGKQLSILNQWKDYTGAGTKKLWVTFSGLDVNWEQARTQFTQNGQTLVIVNPEHPIPNSFDAGRIPVPRSLITKTLTLEFGVSPNEAKELLTALGGLTLRDVHDVCCLAQAKHQELTPRAIRDVRMTASQVVPGVTAVSTDMPFYWEHADLQMWLYGVGSFLLRPVDIRLRPRGLLLTGPPGTGKTLGSKYLARELGIPLFRLDVGALMSKYVGESEQNMNRALSVITQNAPCVMLIDEVEKLFTGGDDSGVTQNLLAGLLWWLQEHESRVLTIMTTNADEKLPPELIRPGRIDSVLMFENLTRDLYADFEENLISSLNMMEDVHYNYMDEHELAGMDSQMSYAELTGYVLTRVRNFLNSLDKP